MGMRDKTEQLKAAGTLIGRRRFLGSTAALGAATVGLARAANAAPPGADAAKPAAPASAPKTEARPWTLMKGKKVAVSLEEKRLPYYRFFEREMAAIPEEKLAILRGGPSKTGAIPFAQRNEFLEGKDQDYCQSGFGTQADGTGFVCNTMYMPGVTGEMLDWWFPWHSVGSDLRYKMWNPEDHYFARAARADYVCDPNVPLKQKTWGVTHYILEDIGAGPDFLKLNFKRPSDFGYDEGLLGTEKCQSLVCAVGEGAAPAAMTHKWYPHQDGVMFCSRFWLGFGVVDGKIVKILPDGVQIPPQVMMWLFGHNIKEYSNLAAILPEVYAENKDNF